MLLTAFGSEQQQVSIAAASDMKFALDELVKTFKDIHSEVKIGITSGSSGKFFEQISHGAPFDLFFSADISLPKKLQTLRLGSEIIPYGVGQIVLWSDQYQISKIEDLKVAKFKKIAIANPTHAPYGARAIEALKKSGLYESIKDRLVFGENVSQAAQFVETGAADVGILALSIVMAPNFKDKGNFKIISKDLYSQMDQGLIILKNKNKAAVEFANFIKSNQAKIILKKYGFQSEDN